jgi:hypothetical protein
MHKLLAIIQVFLLAAKVYAADKSELVDPSLVIVSTGFEFRILVYSVCSPEHCWSETYLQSVSLGSEQPKILCSVGVSEIFQGHVIKDVSWKLDEGVPQAVLAAEASHGGFQPRNVVIQPNQACGYIINGASSTGF